MTNAELQRRFRAKHPDRARLVARIGAARVVAARRVARAHPLELEAEFANECSRQGLPRRPPPIPMDKDGRRLSARPQAKLTWDQVREIRSLHVAGGVSQQDLADEFGVSGTAISYIIRGRSWKVPP